MTNVNVIQRYLEENPSIRSEYIATLPDGTIVTPRLYLDPVTGQTARRDYLTHGYVSVNHWSKQTGLWTPHVRFIHNLLTNGGRDFMHAQVYTNTSAGTRGANYLAVSENSGGASASHTTLAGEITTNGLARDVITGGGGTITHTGGTNTTTFDHTFTASGGTFSAVQLCGTFNASSSGTLVHEATFTSAALQDGDKLQIIYTLNLG